MVKLSHTPPRGAGRVKGISKIEQLLACLRKAGTDKNFNPVAIRSPELAAACQIPVTHVSALLNPCVKDGRVVMCKVTPAHGRPVNEYRLGPGVPPPEHRPLNTRKAGAALGQPGKPLPVTRKAPALSTPKPAEPATPQLVGQPKAGVGQNPASTQSDPASAERRAVAEKAPAPMPERRGMGPAPASVLACDVMRLSIDQDGRLQIGDDEDPARYEFNPAQVLELGDFLHATQGLWRP